MAVIQVNPVARQQPIQQEKDDTLGDILKGLQVANTIIAGIGGIKDVQLKNQQLETAQNQAKGIYNLADATKLGKVDLEPTAPGPGLLPPNQSGPLTPDQLNKGNLLPGMQGPPVAPGKDFEGVLTKTPIQLQTANGLVPASLTDKEQEKELLSQKKDLASQVKGSNEIQIAEQQAGNYRNLVSALEKGNPNADQAAVITAARMYNPGITRAADGSIVGADSLPDELKKYVLRVFGDLNFKLSPEERNQIRDIGKNFFENAAEGAKQAQQQFSIEAVKLGVDQHSVGVGTYDDLLSKNNPKSNGGEISVTKPQENKILRISPEELKKMSPQEKYKNYLNLHK